MGGIVINVVSARESRTCQLTGGGGHWHYYMLIQTDAANNNGIVVKSSGQTRGKCEMSVRRAARKDAWLPPEGSHTDAEHRRSVLAGGWPGSLESGTWNLDLDSRPLISRKN